MKAKRLVALLMAVMLVVGIFAVPASAYSRCPNCGHTGYTVAPYIQQNVNRYVAYCSKKSYGHNHKYNRYVNIYTCSVCGNVKEEQTGYEEWCPA